MALIPGLVSLLPYILKDALRSPQHGNAAEYSNGALILGPVPQAVQTAALFACFDSKNVEETTLSLYGWTGVYLWCSIHHVFISHTFFLI